MNNLDFFKVVIFILKQVLRCYYAPFLRLGGYKWYAYKGGTFSSLMLATIMTRHRLFYNQADFGNYNSARSIPLSRFKSDEYFKTYNFKPALWKSTQMDYLFTIFLLQANWLWSWSIDPDFLEEGNDKDLRMFRCRFTRILNPEHNLTKLFWCLFCRISLIWINPN